MEVNAKDIQKMREAIHWQIEGDIFSLIESIMDAHTHHYDI